MSPLTCGQVGWFDLTVPDAESLRASYQQVVGWNAEAVEMDGYNDYYMKPPGADMPVAGICHARGSNASLPAQWLLYITVANLEESLRACEAAGGKALTQPRAAVLGRFAVIRDPAGAVCALYQAAG